MVGGQLHTGYVTHEHHNGAASTDVKVRQAVNMAINKDRDRPADQQPRRAGQPAAAAVHAAGYDQGLALSCAYDPRRAKALLAEAGHPDGFETELFVS